MMNVEINEIGMTLIAQDDENLIRETERRRIEALVQADVAKAKPFHADDFQLIIPIGITLTRDNYLGAIAVGRLRYQSWEPEDIAVRLYGSNAIIRYRASLEVTFEGHRLPRAGYWHTDSYERQEDRWLVVWSQATMIAQERPPL
jgi:hypothetical protein